MKKLFLLSILSALLFAACEEIPPTVTGSMGGNNNGGGGAQDQQRQVLIEEFTGVRCVQCPAGSLLIEDLLAANSPNLVAISIHAGEFAPPYSESKFDFQTPEGNQILSYLGEPFGFPSAVVNRKKFDGQFDLQLGQGEWAGYIAAERAVPPKVRIDISPEYDPATREVKIDVTLFVDEAISDPDVKLSVMFTETGIKDLQLTPEAADPKPDYTHKHALRGMATSYDGNPITEPLTLGAEIKQSFAYTLPAEWVAENCHIVAFVSLGGSAKDVLQAHEVPVSE